MSRALASQMLRFAIVGSIGFFVDAGLLLLMLGYGLGPIMARAVSFPVALTATWALNRGFTFAEQRSANRGAEMLRYALCQIISAALGFGLYSLLVLTIDSFYQFPVMALVASAALSMISNFTLSHFFVFRSDTQPI